MYRYLTDRYAIRNCLVYYTVIGGDPPRVGLPIHNDMPLCILYECLNIPKSGYCGRKKTLLTISRDCLISMH